MRNVTLAAGGRAGEVYKGWGRGSNGEPGTDVESLCLQATSPGPQETQHQAQLLRALLILTSQFIKGGWGNMITMDRAFGTSLEEASAGG